MTPLQALQRTLAGEHAAIYVYGVAGGRVSDSAQPALAATLADGYAAHRGRRDQLTAMVRAVGGEPVAAEAGYELPTPCRTPAEQREAVLVVEQRCAEVYAQMVGSTARANRQWAIDTLADTAVRILRCGGDAEPFPGVAEL
jgi:hypothetical protein